MDTRRGAEQTRGTAQRIAGEHSLARPRQMVDIEDQVDRRIADDDDAAHEPDPTVTGRPFHRLVPRRCRHHEMALRAVLLSVASE